jgi:hypothetical protein
LCGEVIAPLASPRAPTGDRQRGMSYAHGFRRGASVGYDSPASERSLDRLRELGVSWISITPFGFLSGPADLNLRWIHHAGHGETDEALRKAANDTHARRMRVMLKPHIWLRPPDWPGTVGQTTPEGWKRWFDAYREFILHYARLATSIEADAFCVGTELELTTPHASAWAEIIAAIRGVYRGPLTYASNPQEVYAITFWDRLDFIGVNGYYPLSASRTPKVDELVTAWSGERGRLGALSARWGKPIVFTELGYRSADYGAWKHWEIPREAPVNLEAQRAAYEAFFRAVWPEPWCHGVYWWKWHSFPDHSGPESNDFEIEHKPAEGVVARYYGRKRPSRLVLLRSE